MKGDAAVKRRLKVGKKYERIVLEYLQEHGVACSSPEVTENFTERDVDILLDDGRVIEVKSRSKTCPFTCPEDFRFPTIFVDTQQGYLLKDVKPAFYVIISQVDGSMVWIDGKTHPEWAIEQVYDSQLGYKTWTYVADKGLLRHIDDLIAELTEDQE
jgi:hypothetical protein